MRHAKAAAGGQVVAQQGVPFEQGDEAEVVGEHVHRVVVRGGDGDLEFTRQIRGTVKRFDLVARLGGVGFIEEDLVIGAAGGQQAGGEQLGIGHQTGVPGIAQRAGGGHDIAHHIAAGGLGGEQGSSDGRGCGFQIPLNHAVELYALAGGNAQAGVAVAIGQFIEREILRCGEDAAWHAHAGHEAVLFILTALLAFGGSVAVVLFVTTVKFQ